MNNFRVLQPQNILDISNKLSVVRGDFLNRFEKVMGETVKFAQAASNAIGDISIEEAENGVIEFFRDRMKDPL